MLLPTPQAVRRAALRSRSRFAGAPCVWLLRSDWRDDAYRSDFIADGKIGCGNEPAGAVISALIARPSYSAAIVTSVARTAGSVASAAAANTSAASDRQWSTRSCLLMGTSCPPWSALPRRHENGTVPGRFRLSK
jgi:hypothetical protein